MNRLVFVAVLLFTSALQAVDLKPMYQQYCKLQTKYQQNGVWKSTGFYSGIFLSENANSYLIMTCGHGPAPAPFGSVTYVQCFYNKGLSSQWMRGKVDWYRYHIGDYSNDVGFVLIPKTEFTRVNYPRPITAKISTKNVWIGNDIYTLSTSKDIGFPTAFMGYVHTVGPNKFYCRPQAKAGRSGSAFYNKDGHVVGVLLAAGKGNTTAVNSVRLLELIGVYQKWKNQQGSNRLH